jgi:outer membrane protein OmpA-like peptidoglycan-associated protein
MKNLFVLILIATSLITEVIAQPTVQWANRVVRFSSQYKDDFYSAKQILGPPNAMSGYSESVYSWTPKDANGARDEYVEVEFGIPMRVKQFAIVETLNPGAVRKVYLIDTKGKSHKVFERKTFKSTYGMEMARVFSKKIAFTDYKVAGMKVVLKPSAIKGRNQIDAIAISNTATPIKVSVNTIAYSEPVKPAENLGRLVNSKYSERLPIISPDGNTLYFARKFHPKNIGEANKDDIWVANKYGDGNWSVAKNIYEPLNNDLHNFVIAVSADNNRLYVASAYKKWEKDGVAVAKKKRNGEWGKPQTLKIKNMYNKSPYAGYHINTAGNILVMAVQRSDTRGDRDLYVSFKERGDEWSEPRHMGNVINSVSMESNIFIAADNRTIYFSSNGFAGYGGLDMYISRRLDDSWTNWSEPQNLGNEINTPGNDYNYTIPASGDFAYFSSDFRSYGQSDLFRIKLPKEIRPEPVMILDNEPVSIAVEEELDGDLSGEELATIDKPTNSRLQNEVDALQEKLRRINEELTDWKPVKKKSKPKADIPEDKPIAYNKPTNKKRVTTTTITKTTKTTKTRKKPKADPRLERLKKKYNRHLEDETEEERPIDVATNNKKRIPSTPKPPKPPKKNDELDALKEKMLRLQGKLPKEEPTIAVNDEPIEEEVVTEDPFLPTKKVEKPKVEQPRDEEPPVSEEEIARIKDELRKKLKEELRNDVKNELKKEMIGDVRDEVADEVRIDLKDDLKQKVEDDLKASLEDDVKESLRDDLKDDVKDDLRDELKSDVEKDLRRELEKEVRDEVLKDLRDEMADEVRAELRKEMEYRLKKELEAQIRQELEEKIRAQLEEEYAQKLVTEEPETPKEEEEEVLIVPIKVGQIIPMNNIFFDANKTTVKTPSFKELDKVLVFLNAHPNLIVEVGGHTNSWCSHEFANELSAGRSQKVREYLISKGVSETRIKYHGYGKTKPIADNKTAYGRKRNQRVELKILEILE